MRFWPHPSFSFLIKYSSGNWRTRGTSSMLMQSSLKVKLLEVFRLRMYFFMSVSAVAFFLLLIQLVNLQLVQGREYQIKALRNRENYIPIPAARGDIYDRNFTEGEKNVMIVSSRPSFNITTIPAKIKSEKELITVI